jgi:hypothetical protein
MNLSRYEEYKNGFLQNFNTLSGTQTAFYSVDNGGTFSGGKVTEVDYSGPAF